MTAQSWGLHSTVTPSRLAISVPTSVSKPSHVPSFFWTGCVASLASVEITSLPALRTLSSRPPATGLAGASDAGSEAAAEAGSEAGADAGAVVGAAVGAAVGDAVV